MEAAEGDTLGLGLELELELGLGLGLELGDTFGGSRGGSLRIKVRG